MTQETIKPKDLYAKMKADKKTVVIDVRTPEEFAEAHIPGAKLFPLGSWTPEQLMSMIQAEYSSTPTLYVTCASGRRAGTACDLFRKANMTNAVLIEGGTSGWVQAGFPVEKG